jgi:hypothetical protein
MWAYKPRHSLSHLCMGFAASESVVVTAIVAGLQEARLFAAR